MKRGISFLLAFTFMLTLGTSLLTGCSSQNEYMQNGEWLYLINEKFGFSYPDEKTYETSVDIANEYYNDVQIAYGYGVLPEEMTDIETSASLTNELCALTLAGAIYEPNISEVDIADINKTDYADAVITIVNEGIMPLTSGNKFQPSKKIKYEDAVEYLDRAYYSWVNHHYASYINYTLNDNVIDLGGLSTYYSYETEVPDVLDENGDLPTNAYTIDESYVAEQRKWLSENNFEYDADTGVVTLDNISDKNIEKGCVLTIPDSLDYPTGLYLKINEITQSDSGKYLINVEDAALEEIFGADYELQTTSTLNFADAVILDSNGNIISEGKYADITSNISPMSYTPMERTTLSLGVSKEIKLGKWKAKISGSDGKLGVSVSYDNIEISKEFNNVKADIKIEKGLFGNTKITGNHKFGLSFDSTDKLAIKFKKSSEGTEGSQINSIQSRLEYIAALATIKNGGANSTLKENIDKQKLVDIPISIAPGVSITIGVFIKASIDGTIDISIGYSDGSLAVEVRNLKPIMSCTNGKITSRSVSGSITAEVGPALRLSFCLANFSIADLEAWVGIGAKCTAKLTSVYEDHTIRPNEAPIILNPYLGSLAFKTLIGKTIADNIVDDVEAVKDAVEGNFDDIKENLFCLDINAYWFISGSALTTSSLLGRFIGPFTIKYGGDGDTVFTKIHLEASSTQSLHETLCTLSERVDESVEYGDDLRVEENNYLIMHVGDEKTINITMLPENNRKYYILSDLKFTSDDNTIVLPSLVGVPAQSGVNNKAWNAVKNFFGSFTPNKEDTPPAIKLTAVKEGKTTVTLQTRDGKYKIPLNVTVIPKEVDVKEYYTVSIDTYFISVAVNGTAKVNAVSVPLGKTMDDVFWEIDDTNIARIDSFTGEITGLSEGNCTVKAFIPGYEDSAVYCLVTVSKDYLATNTANSSYSSKQWIKIEGQPVIILERA